MNSARELAEKVLTAAIDEDEPTVERLMDDIIENDYLPEAIMWWADALFDHATDGKTEETVVESMAGYQYDTGAHTEQLPPHIGWAAGMIHSHLTGDGQRQLALVRQFRDADGLTRGDYVMAVLNIAANTIRATPRGYGLMGL